MQITMATEPGRPDHPNEDFIAATPEVLVLLDGAGTPPGLETGCTHSVAWYVRQLGPALLAMAHSNVTLREALAAAITQVTRQHSQSCNLTDSGGPSATVVCVRFRHKQIEYVVLADSTLLIQRVSGTVDVITDTREAKVGTRFRAAMDTAPNGTPEHEQALVKYVSDLRAYRNTPDGFWVASSTSQAASQALTGSIPQEEVSLIALLSDGASRLADRFSTMSWGKISSLLHDSDGEHRLLTLTRLAELSDPEGIVWPRGKAQDDASVITWKTK